MSKSIESGFPLTKHTLTVPNSYGDKKGHAK